MVVGGLALAQSIAQGRAAISAVVAGVVALSYLTPWWLTGWYQHLDRCGDRFVADHGLGAALAGYLRGWPATPRTLTRIRALAPLDPPTATPRLVVVRPGGCEMTWAGGVFSGFGVPLPRVELRLSRLVDRLGLPHCLVKHGHGRSRRPHPGAVRFLRGARARAA